MGGGAGGEVAWTSNQVFGVVFCSDKTALGTVDLGVRALILTSDSLHGLDYDIYYNNLFM